MPRLTNHTVPKDDAIRLGAADVRGGRYMWDWSSVYGRTVLKVRDPVLPRHWAIATTDGTPIFYTEG